MIDHSNTLSPFEQHCRDEGINPDAYLKALNDLWLDRGVKIDDALMRILLQDNQHLRQRLKEVQGENAKLKALRGATATGGLSTAVGESASIGSDVPLPEAKKILRSGQEDPEGLHMDWLKKRLTWLTTSLAHTSPNEPVFNSLLAEARYLRAVVKEEPSR